MRHFLIIVSLILFWFYSITLRAEVIELAAAEDSSLLEDIEQELAHDLQEERDLKLKIERENLTTLEEKKKESVAAEIEVGKDAESLVYTNRAKLIILNKITAKSEQVEFKLGQIKFFGNLSVEVRKCVLSLDQIRPSSLALLTVIDNKMEGDVPVLDGWFDSSSPSISTLEHPVYEIFLVKCVTTSV